MAASVSVSVDLHHAQIRNFLYSPGGPIVRGVRGWANDVRRVGIALAPKDSGDLAGSSAVTMNTHPGFVVGEIAFRARHAIWVHEGTGIYGPRRRPIRSRTGQMLRFPRGAGHMASAGRHPSRSRVYMYARSVRGQPGKPFLVTALRLVMLNKGARIKVFRVR